MKCTCLAGRRAIRAINIAAAPFAAACMTTVASAVAPAETVRARATTTMSTTSATATAAAAAAAGDPTPGTGLSLVLKVGDVIEGLPGAVVAMESMAVDDSGTAVVQVRMGPANPSADQFVIRGDDVVMAEGSPLPGAPAFTVVGFGDLRAASNGSVVQVVNLSGPGFSGLAVTVDGVPVLATGAPATLFGAPANGVWSDFDLAVPRSDGRVTVRGTVTGDGLTLDAVADLFILGGQVILQTTRLLEGQSVDGRGIAGRISSDREDLAVSPDGSVLLSVDIDGAPSGSDGLMAWRPPGQTWMAVGREGSPSPAAGRNWSSLFNRSVAVNDAGDWALQGSLSGDSSTNQLLVRNGEVFAQEGEILDVGDDQFALQGFGSGPLHLLAGGRLVWLADWNATIGFDRGLFVERDLLVRAGESLVDGVDFGAGPVDGVLVSGLEAATGNWSASSTGAWVVARATLRDPNGADVPALLRVLVLGPCAADFDGNDAIDFLDLVHVLVAVSIGTADGDVDGDGDTDFADLVLVLATWGAC
ncbi:MAG: hypothetical protein AB8G96_03630 [Phycisphaerales bacterium]